MIFVTVGTELPFDRLVRSVDAWARTHGRSDVFAQIGHATYEPATIGFERFLDAQEFRRRFESASLVISHAGMGTILTALSLGKPLLVLPRRAEFGEHRNDHQLATARHMQQLRRIEVAFDEEELTRKLSAFERIPVAPRIPATASQELVRTLQAFIAESSPLRPRTPWLERLAPASPAPALDRARLSSSP